MQLHGRMWRQGNPFKYCFIVNVLVKNSIDAFQYSKLDQKINAVKNMLESGVYDVNETQFDVDVNEIKLNLINDAEKLAELEYEQIKDTLATEVKIMQTQVDTLETIENNLSRVYSSYISISKIAAGIWNDFSSVYLLILASSKQEMLNKEVFQAAKGEVTERIFNQQFTDKDISTEEGEKEYDEKYSAYLLLREQRQKFTTAQWEAEKSKKKWSDFLQIKGSLEIQKSLSENDPDVMAIAQKNGLVSYDQAKEMVLQDSRYKKLNSKIEVGADGYLPYSVYDEIQTNLDELTSKFLSQESDAKFIAKYNDYVKLAQDYKDGVISDDVLRDEYVKARIPVFNALFIVYALAQFEETEFGDLRDLKEINVDSFLEVYTKPAEQTGQGTFFTKEQAYQIVSDYEAIPARASAKNFRLNIDRPVNDRTTSIVMQGYERLLKGKGADGGDLTVEDVPTLIANFQAKIEAGNEKLQKPAETKAELAKKFQEKLDFLAQQKDENLDDKVNELSLLYPLIQRK
jgi:hypothetical protein